MKLRDWVRKHWQLAVNWVLFVGIGVGIVVKAWRWHQAGELWQPVEIALLAQLIVFLALLILRTRHIAIDRNLFHQGVALAAFFAGLAFIGEKTTDASLLWSARAVTFVGSVIGILTLVNLGSSFGILIARRRIKTGWLYGIVRHPMYLAAILIKIGMVLKIPSWQNVAVFVGAVACYVYRAILEERFLAHSADYREYMKKVRYRLLPGVF